MYAIRSYYDSCGFSNGLKRFFINELDIARLGGAGVGDQAGVRCGMLAQLLQVRRLDPEFAEWPADARITSYNVCYTKLLRSSDLMSEGG